MAETLKDLVERAVERHNGASGYQLAELARQQGLPLTHTTVNHIRAGTYRSKPGHQTLQAIAYLANVPVERAYSAANLPMPGGRFADELPPNVDYLSPRQRGAVIEVIRAMLDTRAGADAAPEGVSLPYVEAAELIKARAALDVMRETLEQEGDSLSVEWRRHYEAVIAERVEELAREEERLRRQLSGEIQAKVEEEEADLQRKLASESGVDAGQGGGS